MIVGLLPFKPSGNFLDYFDPLKAYQYWAAGLGIAATDTGRMLRRTNFLGLVLDRMLRVLPMPL